MPALPCYDSRTCFDGSPSEGKAARILYASREWRHRLVNLSLIGLASQDYLKKMLDEKFEPFTFSPAKASVYHLGNFGTARKLLHSWELKG